MEIEDRDILEVLRAELDFVEKGGYGRSVRTPWQPTSAFQDSPSCLCYPYHTHENGCVLMQLVPAEMRESEVPCHLIPITEKGETLSDLEARGDQQALEEAYKKWLRSSIERLERERAGELTV
jgi:hypothetical protein